MTVADTATWNPVLQTIVQTALLNVGAIDENEAAGSPAYYRALTVLNGLVKSLEATGIHVWTEEEYILFVQPGQPRYVLDGATSHVALADEWVLLTTSAAAASGDAQITVEETVGVTVGDHLGIVLNNGLTQWVTVATLPGAGVITFADTLDDAVDSGNYAFAYTTTQGRVLQVPKARMYTFQSQNENPMTILSRQEYMDLPQKNQPGMPNQWFYSPQREVGLFYIWQVTNDSSVAIRFTGYRPLLDFLIPTNTADMPQEWVLPLIWNLSKELGTSYGVDDATWKRITDMADQWSMVALSYDREMQPLQFGMEGWLYGDG